MLDDITSSGLLNFLEDNPSLFQRNLVKCLDIGLGKVNSCQNARVEKVA
ncbi:MAG: hypothetical protein WC208_01885 [Gallionella sp.]